MVRPEPGLVTTMNEECLRLAAMRKAELLGNGAIAVQMKSNGGYRASLLNADYRPVAHSDGSDAFDALIGLFEHESWEVADERAPH